MKVSIDLEVIWNRLSNVNSLMFIATSANNNGGWNGAGRGSVVVESVDKNIVLFHENGTWQSETGKDLNFTNVYRWTALLDSSSLRLEHLRFGHRHAVYLFDLKQKDNMTWQSVEPHVCREDLYTAKMKLDGEILSLEWTIKGPTMNESINYSYQ